MNSMKKRLFKTVAVTLSAVMLSYTTLPAAAAYAAPPPPPGHHDMHHHHDTKMNTAAAVIGVALTIGLIAWLKNSTTKPKIPTDPMGYSIYRNDFVDTLPAQERAIYDEMSNCQAGEYKYPYTTETAKTVKKLCKKLPQDFKYSGITTDKESDGTKMKYIIFQRLEANSFGNTKATATTGTLAGAM